jgi:hypothetical protein
MFCLLRTRNRLTAKVLRAGNEYFGSSRCGKNCRRVVIFNGTLPQWGNIKNQRCTELVLTTPEHLLLQRVELPQARC